MIMSNNISIVIIGYNSQNELSQCLDSLNKIKPNQSLNEIIYIDDGSNDDSDNVFKNSKLPCKKKFHKFSKNQGRVFATQKGIELASSSWILFLQSNVVVNSNIINEYLKAINQFSATAYMGKIVYQSSDKRFEKYLNHRNRGLNSTQNGNVINFKNLLFGNCLIKKNIFDKIPLNLNLKKYGGEEIDFAYRLHSKHQNKTRYCSKAIATRINHPNFRVHLDRLWEYGNQNLKKMEHSLQLEIIKIPFLIKINFMKNILLGVCWNICFLLYNLKISILDFYIYRFLMGLSIIRGFYSK